MIRYFLILLFALLTYATASANFTTDADALLRKHVRNGRVNYAALKTSGELAPLIRQISEIDPAALSGDARKAHLINAYNLLVIHQALENYPLKSVLDVKGFFDGTKHQVGGRQLTLNQLEKDLLLKEYRDARLHFVLVCGALGCPPLIPEAYAAGKLEQQLDRQTIRALNDQTFIRPTSDGAALSQIFEWYRADFGGSDAGIRSFINKYRDADLSDDAKLTYYTYDWALNGGRGNGRAALGAPSPPATAPPSTQPQPGAIPVTVPGGANNAARYVVSSTIRQGTAEFRVFNNRYSQEVGDETSTFFTTIGSALYGVTDRFNAGLEGRYRRASYAGGEADVARSGLVSIGPKVRVAPVAAWPNFSIQSALWFQLGDDLTGAATGQRFLDWDGPTSWTQLFNDFPIGSNFSIFTEVDVLIEDIGAESAGRLNRFSTPVTGIFSYFPTPKATLYALGNYSPFWQADFDYFYQAGLGAKYQFTPKFELELLATAFDNQFLSSVDGTASTLNLGIRFNL